jgi:hypothetical protein
MKMFYFTTRDGAYQGECFFSGDMVFIQEDNDPVERFCSYKLDYRNDAAPEFMEGVLLFGTEIERGQYLVGTGKA